MSFCRTGLWLAGSVRRKCARVPAMIMPERARKVAIPLLCFVLVIGIFKVIGAILSPFNEEKFNRATWDAATSNEAMGNCLRGGMADDIVRNVISIGMRRERVAELLGKSPWVQGNKDEYLLGFCSGIGADYDGLILSYDAAGKLADIDIYQH